MDTSYSVGALIPLWILLAPVLGALFMLMVTPRPTRRSEPREHQPPHHALAPPAPAAEASR